MQASNVTIVILINTHWIIYSKIPFYNFSYALLPDYSCSKLFSGAVLSLIIACLKLSIMPLNVHPLFCRGCWWVWVFYQVSCQDPCSGDEWNYSGTSLIWISEIRISPYSGYLLWSQILYVHVN